MAIIKQGSSYNRAFLMVETADHITGSTGLTVTVNLSKVSSSGTTGFGASSGSVTEVSNGWYYLGLNATDSATVGDLVYHCTTTSTVTPSDPTDFVDQVQTHVFSDLNIDGSGNISIASNIKKNQALSGFTFPMTISGLPTPGLAVTAQRSLNAAGFATCASTVVELSNGVYSINLAASDTNANTVILRFTATGADDRDILLLTQP